MSDDLEATYATVSRLADSVVAGPPAALRARADRRARLRRIPVRIAVVAAIATVSVFGVRVLQANQSLDGSGGGSLLSRCPPGSIAVSLRVPEYSEMKLRVIDGGPGAARTETAVRELELRGLVVVGSYSEIPVDEVAVIRSGPKSFAAGWVMRAFFLDEASVEYDPARSDDVVEVVLGQRFSSLATLTEVNQSIAVLPPLDLPPGTCGE